MEKNGHRLQRRSLCLALASPGCAAAAGAGSEPVLNVLDCGAAGDGSTDNTKAFQAALDAAGDARGGTVFAPGGRYSFSGSLRVPKDVTLRGTFSAPPSHSYTRTKQRAEYGTVLLPRGGAGSEEGPAFIDLDSNAVLQGVCVFYPDQKLDPPPVAYPYTVHMHGNNPAVLDCELLNPYNAIKVVKGGRQLVRNVCGQPLHIGVLVDEAGDCCRLENVHWNPYWSYQTPLSRWQLDNGVGFIFGRTDGQYALNTFCFNYDIGYRFIRTKAGAAYGNFSGANAELCHACVQVDDCDTWGILFSQGGYALLDPPRSMMVRVGARNRGTVRFSNCAFWGPTDRCAHIEGDDIGMVAFANCTFAEWPENRAMPRDQRWLREPCITALGGSVLIQGCEFRDHKPHVYLGPNLRGAIVSNNIMHWPVDIRSDMKNEAIVKDNLGLPPARPPGKIAT